MNYLLLISFAMSSVIYSSDVPARVKPGSPLPKISIPSSRDSISSVLSSDEEVLCNAALSIISNHSEVEIPNIKDLISKIILDDKSSPLVESNSSSSPNAAHELAIKASQKALAHKHLQVDELQKQLEAKLSKKLTALITAGCTSGVTLITSLLVHYNASK